MKIIVNGATKELAIKPGHKCFKLKVGVDKLEVVEVKVMEHADGLYCSALNLKNAIKTFNKMINYAETNQTQSK